MGENKLAGELGITRQQALDLTAAYFKAFPLIKRTLDFLSEFGIKHGYCKTPAPFFRKRWFPFWHLSKWKIPYHLGGVEYDSNLGAIGRQSSNQPIQGCSADVTKQALVFIYEWKRANGLNDKIKLKLQVHDQITTTCDDDIKEMWKLQMDKLMCDAAKVVIPSGILRSETNITSFWTK
jgi:DNA polymerase I-like protein with 3'-5' exonuclease and polymerase domains